MGRQMARLDAVAVGILMLSVLIAIAAVALCLAVPYFAWRFLVTPIAELTRTVQRLSAGEDSAATESRGFDELSALSGCIDELAGQLAESSRTVRELASYDATTGLANRRLFMERLRGGIVAARRPGTRNLFHDSQVFYRARRRILHAVVGVDHHALCLASSRESRVVAGCGDRRNRPGF